MADYNYPDDGKLHCRYSELIRCTAGGIETVIAERLEGRRRVETEAMAFGTERHAMWQEEAEKTGWVADCFNVEWPVSHVEHEFATEILPGVVVHSRPDIVVASKNLLPDYKTVVDGKQGWRYTIKQYAHATKQRQLKFYAFQLGLHGILIREGAFLCEIWNKDRDTIVGYEIVRFPITLADMAGAVAWAKPRIAMLAATLESYQKSKQTAGIA